MFEQLFPKSRKEAFKLHNDIVSTSIFSNGRMIDVPSNHPTVERAQLNLNGFKNIYHDVNITYSMTSGYELIEEEMVKSTLSTIELLKKFDGGAEGKSFTLGTEEYVYFPAVHDGLEWAASVPRNPCDVVTAHVGGE